MKFNYSEIEVKLTEKNSGVLTNSVIEIKFPKAGGQVDLAQYVKNSRGSFRKIGRAHV